MKNSCAVYNTYYTKIKLEQTYQWGSGKRFVAGEEEQRIGKLFMKSSSSL